MDELIAAAKRAAERAYAPYSRFPVGAAVRAGSGRIYAGCNVENASYGLAVCAERNAVFHAVAAGELRIEALGVYTPTPSPTAPCGACRQVVAEFGPQARVRCVCDGPDMIDTTMALLLPESFALHSLPSGR